MSVCLALQTMQGRMSYSLFKFNPFTQLFTLVCFVALKQKHFSVRCLIWETGFFYFITQPEPQTAEKKERDWSWTDVKLYFKKSESVVNAKTQLTSNHLLIIDEKEPSTRYRKFIDLGNRNVKTTRLFTHLFSSLY